MQAQNEDDEEKGVIANAAEDQKLNVDKSRSALGSAWQQTPDAGGKRKRELKHPSRLAAMSSLKAKIAAEDLNAFEERERNRILASQTTNYNPSSGPFPGIGTSFDDGFVNGTACICQNTKFDELLRKHGVAAENQDIKSAAPTKLTFKPQRSRSLLNSSKAVIEPPIIKSQYKVAEAQERNRVGGQLHLSAIQNKLRSYDTEQTLHDVQLEPKSP